MTPWLGSNVEMHATKIFFRHPSVDFDGGGGDTTYRALLHLCPGRSLIEAFVTFANRNVPLITQLPRQRNCLCPERNCKPYLSSFWNIWRGVRGQRKVDNKRRGFKIPQTLKKEQLNSFRKWKLAAESDATMDGQLQSQFQDKTLWKIIELKYFLGRLVFGKNLISNAEFPNFLFILFLLHSKTMP